MKSQTKTILSLILLIIIVFSIAKVISNKTSAPNYIPPPVTEITLSNENIDYRFGLFYADGDPDKRRELDVHSERPFLFQFDKAKEIIQKDGQIKEKDVREVFTVTPLGADWENEAIKELRRKGVIGDSGGFLLYSGFPDDIEEYKQDFRFFVELMDRDGKNDLERFIEYPVEAIEILNEPGVEWFGNIKISDAENINSQTDLRNWKEANLEEIKESLWEFIKINYEILKEENPDIEVIVNDVAVINIPKGKVEEYSNYFDIIDVHFYGTHVEFEEKLNRIKELGKEYNIDKTLWSFELAGPAKDTVFSTKEEFAEHSNEVIKLYMVGFSYGMERLYYATLVPIITFGNPLWYNLALLDDDLDRKPAFYTYKLLIEKMKGFSSVEKISQSEHYYRINFADKDPIYILWNNDGKSNVDLSNYVMNEVKVTHIVTELNKKKEPIILPEEIISSNSIPISKSPIFVEEIKIIIQ